MIAFCNCYVVKENNIFVETLLKKEFLLKKENLVLFQRDMILVIALFVRKILLQ